MWCLDPTDPCLRHQGYSPQSISLFVVVFVLYLLDVTEYYGVDSDHAPYQNQHFIRISDLMVVPRLVGQNVSMPSLGSLEKGISFSIFSTPSLSLLNTYRNRYYYCCCCCCTPRPHHRPSACWWSSGGPPPRTTPGTSCCCCGICLAL